MCRIHVLKPLGHKSLTNEYVSANGGAAPAAHRRGGSPPGPPASQVALPLSLFLAIYMNDPPELTHITFSQPAGEVLRELMIAPSSTLG